MPETVASEMSRSETEVHGVWNTLVGKHVAVSTLPGSYAARQAATEMREADRVLEALEKLLEPPREQRGASVAVFLTDPVTGDAPQADDAEGRLVRVLQPDASTEPICLPLTRLLIARWFGSNAAQAALFVSGIAGYAAARAGTGPSLKDADAWVQNEIEAGRPILGMPVAPVVLTKPPAAPPTVRLASAPAPGAVAPNTGALAPDPVAPAPAPSVMAPPAKTPPARETGGLDLAATAFVANIIRLFGAASLRKFLADYDPARRDQAAVSAYQQPLAALQGSWLSGLQRKPGGGAALQSFLKSLGPILRPYRWRQLEIFAYMLFGAAYSQVLPYASKYLIDNISNYFRATIRPEPHIYASHLLIHYAAILFFVYLLNALMTMRQNYATGWINMHLLVALQERLFVHLQRLSHNFYANAKVGDLMTRLSSDMQSVQGAANQVINTGLYQSVILLAAIGSILFQTFKAGVPLMGLLMLCIIPLFALSFVSLRGLMRTASREQQKRVGEAATTVQENLNAQPLIKALGLEEQAIAGYHARLTALLKAGLRLALLGGVSGMSAQMMATISQLIVLCVGGYYVLTNPDALGHSGMTLGTLLLLTQLLPLMLAPVAGLANVGQSVQAASGALDRILELTDEPVAIADKPGAVSLAPLSQGIRLEHISFGYGGPKPILSDLDLTIPAGANVAFVGPSGCGKSTTINLLMRFYDPEAGRVLFDGQDLRDVTLASLRSQIGLVFQETFIFDTTVAENIRIARMDATDDEVIVAARSAQLDDFVQALPDKYNTILGERGARMSGGQRQRLAIARVILRNPRILILDEATSALDAHTEAEILETLSQLTKGRTTIAITHRLSWAATADRIYVLDKGKLAEEGSHAELVGAGGLYQTLYEEQTGFATGVGTERGGVQATRLGMVPLFAGLDEDALAALASHLRRETVKTGADIVSQGEPGDKLYVINGGGADVLVTEGGGERRVNTLAVGDYFGEMALLSGAPRTATVRATAPTELYSLAQADFQALLDMHPALEDAVTQTMKNRRVALVGASEPIRIGDSERPPRPQ